MNNLSKYYIDKKKCVIVFSKVCETCFILMFELLKNIYDNYYILIQYKCINNETNFKSHYVIYRHIYLKSKINLQNICILLCKFVKKL